MKKEERENSHPILRTLRSRKSKGSQDCCRSSARTGPPKPALDFRPAV